MRRFLTIALALALATACGTKARDPDAAPMEGDAEAGDPIIESDASMPDAAVTNRCTGDLHGVLDDNRSACADARDAYLARYPAGVHARSVAKRCGGK